MDFSTAMQAYRSLHDRASLADPNDLEATLALADEFHALSRAWAVPHCRMDALTLHDMDATVMVAVYTKVAQAVQLHAERYFPERR